MGSGKISLPTISLSGQGNVGNTIIIALDGQSHLSINSIGVGERNDDVLYLYKDNSQIASYHNGTTNNISFDISGATEIKFVISGWTIEGKYKMATISGLTIE